MADFMSGIRKITPSYPVRPVQPANRDRDPEGKRKNKHEPDVTPPVPDTQDADDTPHIDEHV